MTAILQPNFNSLTIELQLNYLLKNHWRARAQASRI